MSALASPLEASGSARNAALSPPGGEGWKRTLSLLEGEGRVRVRSSARERDCGAVSALGHAHHDEARGIDPPAGAAGLLARPFQCAVPLRYHRPRRVHAEAHEVAPALRHHRAVACGLADAYGHAPRVRLALESRQGMGAPPVRVASAVVLVELEASAGRADARPYAASREPWG